VVDVVVAGDDDICKLSGGVYVTLSAGKDGGVVLFQDPFAGAAPLANVALDTPF